MCVCVCRVHFGPNRFTLHSYLGPIYRVHFGPYRFTSHSYLGPFPLHVSKLL